MAAGVLLSVLLPLWRNAGVDRATLGTSPRSAQPVEPPIAGLEPALWTGILEREGLEGARRRLQALGPSTDEVSREGAAGLIREGRRQVRQGRVRTSVDLALLAILIDPTEPDAYAVLADACGVLGDGACAARARRSRALVVGHRTR